MPKKKNFKFLKTFILKNVESPQRGYVSRFWPKEMKIAKELFSKFPDESFFENIDFGKKVPSLSWFKTEKYLKQLETKYKHYKYVPQKKESNLIDLSDGKFGETLHNNKTKKFLKDFL